MPKYRYHTVDARGQPISGQLEAARIDQALEQLRAQGLDPAPDEIEEIGLAPIEPDGSTRPLSTGEAAQFAGNLGELTQAELPLGPGLRAMAAELRNRTVSRLFRRLARQIDDGVPLETAVESTGHQFPAHVRGLILAGTRSGRLAEVMGEFAALEQERSDLAWRIAVSLSYPLLLVLTFLLLTVLSGIFIVPQFVHIFEDFDVGLPVMTEAFIAVSTNGVPGAIAFLVILAGFSLFLLVMPRPRWLTGWLYSAPILGRVWKWQGLVEFSRLMGLLLDQDVPMPEALRLTGEGMQAPRLRIACLESAAQIEAGETFSACVERYRAFPITLKPFVDFGSQSSRPAEGFEAAAEAFQRRVGVDAAFWEIVLPPLMLVMIGGFVGWMVLSLFLPLISIITTLS